MRAAYAEPHFTRYSFDDLEYALRTGLTSVLGSRPSVEVLAVALAKVRLETGNGQHCWNHNLGNVKCSADAPGNFTCILLNEVEKKPGDAQPRVYWYDPTGELLGGPGSKLKGKPLAVPDGHAQTRMQARANVTDAGYFYVDFIFSNKRYSAAQQGLLAGSPEAYVRGLKQGGYFTAPLESYLKGVMPLYSDSLAKLRGQPHAEIVQPSRNDFYNQLLLDGLVASEYAQLQDELNLGSGRAALDADEDETGPPLKA